MTLDGLPKEAGEGRWGQMTAPRRCGGGKAALPEAVNLRLEETTRVARDLGARR
jgi:hypothetical protein